jgi:hypothetical protein
MTLLSRKKCTPARLTGLFTVSQAEEAKMMVLKFLSRNSQSLTKLLILGGICCLLIALAACTVQPTVDPSLSQTQVAMGVQLTVMAQQLESNVQATVQAQNATQAFTSAQATLLAQAPQPTVPPPIDYVATQAVLEATQTAMAQPAATQPPPEPTQPAATEAPDLESFMKSASILLYEDIIYRPETTRYVKRTLDEMGLAYVDTGSAIGRFKSQLLTGGPGGKGWDLIIIASEAKAGASGEFYQYVSEALDKGSSVIYELWYLDEKMGVNGAALLSRCGVEFQKDWNMVPVEREVMYPVNDTHPIMHEPNDGLTFTKVTDFWADDYDLGDLMRKSTVGGDATILIGTIGTESTNHGTLTVCVDDQLIMQTFSTHQLTYDVMRRVWENYIYNALKTRMRHLPQ